MDQQEAVKKNELPEGVKLAEPAPPSNENEQVKDKLAEYGETNLEQFLTKMTSDSIYARGVLRHMLGLDEKAPNVTKTAGSPQEHNITGTLVHTEYPPVLKHSIPMNSKEGESSVDGSGSEKYGAGDWTQTKGEGVTDNTESNATAV